MAPARLICAGSLTIDNVLTADRRLLPPMFGGNVVYAGLGARLWHGNVGLLSRAGADYPRDYLSLLADSGLDIAGIVAVDRPHGMNVVFRYEKDGSRTRKFTEAMLAELPEAERARMIDYSAFNQDHRYRVWSAFAPSGADIPDAWLADLAGMHCAAMPVEHHISLARRIAARPGAPWVQVDSPWYDERDLSADHTAELFPLIDALLPSESDIAVTGAQGEVERLSRSGLRLLVVKRGGDGSEIFWPDGQRLAIPVLDGLDVHDFTGAGDAFCGGFLAGMHLTGDPVTAARYGTVSASFAIEAAGIMGLLEASPARAADRLERLSDPTQPALA